VKRTELFMTAVNINTAKYKCQLQRRQ